MFSTLLLSLAASSLALAAPQTKRQQAEVVYSCTQPNTVALTFDDGPWEYLWSIVNTLNDHGAKGTFFFNGNNYECIYDEPQAWRVKYAYDQGHQIASHTWSHAHLNDLSWDQVHDEMWRVEQALERIAGVTPAFMRPPYGEYNDQVREAAYIRGQTLAIWDFDSGDSVGKSADESNSEYDNLVNSHPNNVLALNHEVYESTANDVLPHAIQTLQAAGYNLVTLAECVGMEPYQNVGEPQTNDGSWGC